MTPSLSSQMHSRDLVFYFSFWHHENHSAISLPILIFPPQGGKRLYSLPLFKGKVRKGMFSHPRKRTELDYDNLNTKSPASTLLFPLITIFSTTPPFRALIFVCIFMASITNRGCSFFTLSPCLT